MTKDDNQQHGNSYASDVLKIARNVKYGRWTLIQELARGGNSHIWLARDDKNTECAIKLLTKLKQIAFSRFKIEVETLEKHSDLEGILPLLDRELPAEFTKRRPWYAMPVAVPLWTHLSEANLTEIVRAVFSIATSLVQLHDRNVTHRDIKPANLLFRNGKYFIGDFGLVDFPEKEDLTGKKHDLGPRWTMAPEIFRHASEDDTKPSDVYSLAKSLWILITRVEKGFDGQYDPASEVGIKNLPMCRKIYITQLDEVLRDATEHDPTKRPTMHVFAQRLKEWLDTSNNFDDYNPLEWLEVQKMLFPMVVPSQASWVVPDSIIAVLNILGNTSNLNHLFFPSGGGHDLLGAKLSVRESGCIELIIGGGFRIIKPKQLLFESFDDDPQWNYFRLEADNLEPTGIYPDIEKHSCHEFVVDVGGCRYEHESILNDRDKDEDVATGNYRLVERYFRGSFVIFQKTSLYNRNPSTYDARHDKMTSEAFREYIARIANEMKKHPELQNAFRRSRHLL